jgi:hypothetical protein
MIKNTDLSKIHSIGENFLKNLDKIIDKRKFELSCNDINEIYGEFWDNLKEIRGNSSGFTGLSEFLIFSMIKNILTIPNENHIEIKLGKRINIECYNCKKWKKPPESDIHYFYDGDVLIGNSVPVFLEPKYLTNDLKATFHPKCEECGSQLDFKRYYPDIAIYLKNNIIAVIQVKVCLTYGTKTIDTEIKNFGILHKKYKKLRSLLIIYDLREGKCLSYLKECKNKYNYFNFLGLRNNNKNIANELIKSLELNRIKSGLKLV